MSYQIQNLIEKVNDFFYNLGIHCFAKKKKKKKVTDNELIFGVAYIFNKIKMINFCFCFESKKPTRFFFVVYKQI